MRINGIKVIDAKAPLALRITKSDVSRGNTKDPAACAAARCLMRQPDIEAARIHIGRSYVKKDGKWFRYRTTAALRSEIIAFDRGADFAPGDYKLNPLSPSEMKKLGKRQGSAKPGARDKGSKDRTPKKPRKKYHQVAGVRGFGANR